MQDHRRILYFSSQFPNPRSPNMGIFSLQRVIALQHAGCELLVVESIAHEIRPRVDK